MSTAAEFAMAKVSRVRDDPDARLALLFRLYSGPGGDGTRHLPYRCAAVAFIRWQLQVDSPAGLVPALFPPITHPARPPWTRSRRDGEHAWAVLGWSLGKDVGETEGAQARNGERVLAERFLLLGPGRGMSDEPADALDEVNEALQPRKVRDQRQVLG